MVSVVLGGHELSDFSLSEPAASVRVLLPSTPGSDLVIPVWTGNEFLLPNGERPVIRTLTPRRFDATAGELEVQIVVHDGGAASRWVSAAAAGRRGGDVRDQGGATASMRTRLASCSSGTRRRSPPSASSSSGCRQRSVGRGAHRGRPARGGASASGARSDRDHVASPRVGRFSRRRARRCSRIVDDRGRLEGLGRRRGRRDVPHPASPLRRARLATRPRNRPRVLEARPSRRRRLTFAQSGRRESNSRSQLGKLMFCR